MGRLLLKTAVIITLLAVLICSVQPALSLTVTVSANKESFDPNAGSVTINYNLDTYPYASAISATLRIKNSADNVVWTHSPGTAPGSGQVTWNGRDSGNNVVPNGQYTIDYTATSPGIDGPMTETSQAHVTVYVPPPSDTIPPVTTCTLSGTGGPGVFSSAVTITLAATDTGGSGVVSTTYRLNGGSWQAYSGPFTVSNNGNHSLSYRSVDHAENLESEKVKYFYIGISTVTPSPTAQPVVAPKADFFADPLNGEKPLTVRFYDRSAGTSLTYTWYFGDGTSGDQNPTHVYQNAGTYEVSLRVTNAEGTDQKIIPGYITVKEPQQNNGGGGQNDGGSIPANELLVLNAIADPASVDKDKNTVITVSVKDRNNTPVPDAKVTLTAPEGVTLIPATGITNESGACQFSFTSSGYGNYTLNAMATKQGYTNGTCQTMVLVSGNDLSCLLTLMPVIFVIALIILLLLAAMFLLMRSTKVKLEPRRTIIPADGKTTVPVSITLLNGLGRPKKVKKDTDIAMGTTSGTISDVVMLAGSNTAQAMLTSSKEFGPVIISANYGNKAARANVEFKYDLASLDIVATPDTIPADGTSTSAMTVSIKNEAGDIIAPLEEKIVELRTTLGRIQSPVRLPARSLSANAVLTAGETGGEAIITALMGSVKGEAKVTLKGTPKRFCMHCGASMSMDAPACPKCGQTPPSGEDTKLCTTCDAILPGPAKFCHKCGARQPETVKPQLPQNKDENKK